MRLRGCSICKLLTLLVVAAFIIIVYIYHFMNRVEQDAFLTHLATRHDGRGHKKDLGEKSLLNLTNFQYTIESNVCQRFDRPFLGIIIVTSYVGHDELRAAHRQAISRLKLAEMGLRRVFLLAEIPKEEKFITQQQVQSEQSRWRDLLQGNFQEAYRNLSYKHVMGLRWAATACNRAKFIIKMDDDIVFDVFQLRRYLESLELEEPALVASNALLAGYIIYGKSPIRNVVSKWFVSEEEFPDSVYPDYLSGWLYITNRATALRLVQEARQTPFFWIDDTWVTGIVRGRLHLPMQHLNSWFSANSEYIDCCVRDLKDYGFECDYFVGPNGGDNKLLVEFLHSVEKCYFDECVKRTEDNSIKDTCVANVKHFLPDHGIAILRQIKFR